MHCQHMATKGSFPPFWGWLEMAKHENRPHMNRTLDFWEADVSCWLCRSSSPPPYFPYSPPSPLVPSSPVSLPLPQYTSWLSISVLLPPGGRCAFGSGSVRTGSQQTSCLQSFLPWDGCDNYVHRVWSHNSALRFLHHSLRVSNQEELARPTTCTLPNLTLEHLL